MKLKFLPLFLIALIGVGGASAFAKPHRSLVCKSWVSGNGIAHLKVVAKTKAKMNWRNKVIGTYGAAWSNLGLAKVGAFPCNKIAPAKWSCTLRAIPCKKIGFGLRRAN